jgi:hypothetical protein
MQLTPMLLRAMEVAQAVGFPLEELNASTLLARLAEGTEQDMRAPRADPLAKSRE